VTPILIFDGECGFCTRCVTWLLARSRVHLRAVPWQTGVYARFGLTSDQARRTVWWVTETGRLARGHAAIARALIACGAPWAWLGRVMLVPPLSWIAAIGYRLVSRNRRHLPGTTPAGRRTLEV